MTTSRLPLMLVALLLSAMPASAQLVNYELVSVGNPGNAADQATGGLYGDVNHEYRIGKYEVTIGQYAAFLNAVAKSDPNGLWHENMASNLQEAGISRTGNAGDFSYNIVGPSGVTPPGADSAANRPITNVSWFDAARFANWMTNGQGSSTTDSGAYTISTGQITAASRTSDVNTYTLATPSTLSVGDQVVVSGLTGYNFNVSGIVASVSGLQFTMMPYEGGDVDATGTSQMTGATVAANSNAAYRLPTENEWYKAAYFSAVLDTGNGGYHRYATQSDMAPGNTIGLQSNQANYRAGVDESSVYAVTQSPTQMSSQNYLTNVGAFENSASFYGTFDQTGNVTEWTEAISSMSQRSDRILRDGSWLLDEYFLSSSQRESIVASMHSGTVGFRLASPVAVPEPSACATMTVAGLAGGYSLWRRRKRG